jgi:hypothetical protein
MLLGEHLGGPYVARRDSVDACPVTSKIHGQAAYEAHHASLAA